MKVDTGKLAIGIVLDSVKTFQALFFIAATMARKTMSTKATIAEKTYHHGDLPTALRATTAELITEKGATGFSLREVARRAGVSHAAPAHHFGDSRGLLTSVAAEGFRQLVAGFEGERSIEDPIQRLNCMGKIYVKTAMAYPGHFGVMCASELIDPDDEEYCEVAGRAFDMLLETVTELAQTHNPDLDIEPTAIMIWSTVHGLAVLQPGLEDSENKDSNGVDALIDHYTDMLTKGMFGAKG